MKNSTTYTSPHRPLFLRFPNALELLLNAWGKSLVDYSASTCIETAKKKTGLDDFGSFEFHEPLAMLIKSIREDARLTFIGKMFVRTMIIRTLVNRLKIENDLKTHPEILDQPITKPLIIIGLPRTGTTLLHHLLAQDPHSRFLRCWEAMTPSPPPRREKADTDKRILTAKFFLGLKKYFSPEIFTVKPIEAKGPEECIILLMHSFLSHRAFTIFLNNPQYLNWLKHQNLTGAYQYYYHLLQLLQWRDAKDHWVLKAPEHLINIEPLLKVFPDACLIQTHRDLATSVPSSCSMMAVFRGSYSNFVDLNEIGKTTLEWMSDAIKHVISVRKKHDSSRFCDIQYRDLTRDPIGSVHKIYDYFGYPCSSEMNRRMRAWLRKHPRHKKGIHRYSLSQFNLNKEDIQRQFQNYYKTYQVAVDKR